MKTENLTCQKCSSTFEWKDEFSGFFKPDLCPPCDKERQREIDERIQRDNEAREALRMASIRGSVHSRIDPLFRATDINHPRFNRTAWEKLKDWQPTAETPWLGLVGRTGACKSRIAYLLASRLIEELSAKDNIRFEFVSSCELSELCAAITFGGFDAKAVARRRLQEIRGTGLLLIDDLGKGRMIPSIAPEFFNLIDFRYRQQLPMIWTANSTPEEIAAPMPEDMAAPFAGRLNDSSRIARFKS